MFGVPTSPWIFPEEQERIIRFLYNCGLIKFSNKRDLPLKKGGYTDVYINLRDARDHPGAIEFLAELFRIPLERLGVDRFVEVPDSVSCFAGPLSILTDIPYVTIRQQGKEGRVSDAKKIGHPEKSERVVIIDDVITDGESKIVPAKMCRELELDNLGLVVLVDRQQGWQEHLALSDVNLPVWAGMTLHDVRRHLIQSLGVMERCDREIEMKNPIIVALDGRGWDEILPVIEQLRTTGCVLKVNDLVFGQGIENLLPDLSVYGRLMVDLKCHDIPNTVENTCNRLRPWAPWGVTVHASGGHEMIQAACRALDGLATKVLAVTVLTSIDADTCEEVYHEQPMEQVMALAELAENAGAHGLVCSPKEVKALREKYPDMTLVTPGIRSAGQDAGDQKRIATPEAAIANGSNHLVMGRQIFGAKDPVAEVRRLLKDELKVL